MKLLSNVQSMHARRCGMFQLVARSAVRGIENGMLLSMLLTRGGRFGRVSMAIEGVQKEIAGVIELKLWRWTRRSTSALTYLIGASHLRTCHPDRTFTFVVPSPHNLVSNNRVTSSLYASFHTGRDQELLYQTRWVIEHARKRSRPATSPEPFPFKSSGR